MLLKHRDYEIFRNDIDKYIVNKYIFTYLGFIYTHVIHNVALPFYPASPTRPIVRNFLYSTVPRGE